MLTPSELRSFPWKDLSWLIVNEGELCDLLEAFGAVPPKTSEQLVERAGQLLQALNTAEGFSSGVSVICTLGAEGIIYFQPPNASGGEKGSEGVASTGHLPAAKLLNGLKDTTGAGDCFAGYFAAGLMRGEDLEEVLKNCLTVGGSPHFHLKPP